MARKIWTGSINFGLVTIPVGLYAATEDHSPSFHQYQRGTTDRVRYKRVNERTGDEVDYGEIVKGREVEGVLVTVDQQELDEIAPGRSRTIDITSFVDLDEIDPVYFQRTYWLAPNAKENHRPYDLLRRAMEQTNQVGIARFVLRGKEYLTAVRADETALALNTLFFDDEIREPGEIIGDAGGTAPSDKEIQMAETVIESMTGEWRPQEYEDTYTERVEQLLADKAHGVSPEAAEEPSQATDVIDLTDALRRSVEQARGKRGGRTGGDDLGELNKGELDKRAKELGVRGRSKMNRSDLEAAVRDAASGSRAAS
ncbi:Ku protein [Saccharopolyspora gloriosae]|uniref:Non-homologous end joining protein Ku n=1 Tax=Saccharopolyspora gloriosae TaxID=455344 RepID=A0A840NC63_9PSEU|nr:Ku protein [Saccharopolyspora gloriosae]MBB5069530.1 DNA end-binding protein Ku [Saccharopolyspora gloriosae]